MGLISFFTKIAPFAAMVTLETIVVGSNTLNKEALSQGMSRYSLILYSNSLATILLLPYVLFFHRFFSSSFFFNIGMNWEGEKIREKNRFPCQKGRLSSSVSSGRITLNHNLLYTGVDYSSPTLASAMRNLVPAITFVLAVVFRMEILDLRRSGSLIKILATLLSISGAIIVILYKGPSLISLSSISSKTSMHFLSDHLMLVENNWVIGGIFLAISSICAAIWIIFVGAILKEYPSEVTVMGFYFLFASIQCFAVSLVAERNNPNAWKISPDIELVSIIYYGLIASVIGCCLEAWCIRKKGPLFAAMFKPLSIPIASVIAFVFLGEALYLGTIIGGIVVIMGLYGVIWVKSKENEENQDSEGDFPSSSSKKEPLLQNWVDV